MMTTSWMIDVLCRDNLTNRGIRIYDFLLYRTSQPISLCRQHFALSASNRKTARRFLGILWRWRLKTHYFFFKKKIIINKTLFCPAQTALASQQIQNFPSYSLHYQELNKNPCTTPIKQSTQCQKILNSSITKPERVTRIQFVETSFLGNRGLPSFYFWLS